MDWVSGETESRIVNEGEEASSGALLENRVGVELEAREDWESSLLAKLGDRDVESKERDRIAQKWIFWYLIVAASVSLLGGALWWVFEGLGMGLMVFISVLVVSCPCALGIAWPFADEIALMKLKGRGVFVTTHSLWNRLSRIRRVVFDKTGTLTRSCLTLVNVEVLEGLGTETLKALSSLCCESRHPVSVSLREQLMAKGLFRPEENSSVLEEVGQGLSMKLDGRLWRLGRGEWALTDSKSDGRRGTFLVCDELERCRFFFEDKPLPDSKREVAALTERGLALSILSGDRQEKADRVGRLLGFSSSSVVGNLRPEEKARWLEEHEAQTTLMVGDGANDTLAFESALCCGAPANEQGIVAERADFHYLGNGIQGIRSLLEMGSRRRFGIGSLLTFAIAYNVVAVGFALGGLMTPLLAAILMPLSSIVSLAIVWGTVGKSDR